ncbi:MAG: hypothetical protein WBQ82_05445 [Methyloceanibacter sp.]
MIDLRQGISRLGYVLLILWGALFVVLVGHVWWDGPERLLYITADIWFDILTIMIGVPLGVFLSWRLFKRFVGRPKSADP